MIRAAAAKTGRRPGRLVACALLGEKRGNLSLLFIATTAGKEPEWSGPTQPPHTRSKQVKRIPRRLLPSHGEARAQEPRHRISGEQVVLELQARALLGLLVAFTSGGEGELRLGDHDLVHFMTTAGESQSNRGHLLLSQRSAAKPLQQARL